MLIDEVTAALETGASAIRQAFNAWRTPECFLQFNTGFDIQGLFDDSPQELPLRELPLMPAFHTPDRHQPVLLYGQCQGAPVLAALGHRHLFEGLGPVPCILPTCLAWKLGIPRTIFLDPVLSLNPDIKTGSWTLLTDFINGHHVSPLDGLHAMLDTPFPDMTHALSQHLNSELANALSQVAVNIRFVVYEALPGSHFCTPAEARMGRAVQADVVGHDMVMEIIAAHALQRQVAAFAFVADMAPQDGARPLSRKAILENCRICSEPLIRGIRLAIGEITAENAHQHRPLPDATADDVLFQDFKRPSGQIPALKKFLRR